MSSPSTLPLTNRVAVVTGASGGIGRAMAVELARAGADVVVHFNSRQQAAEETASAVRALGREALVARADLANTATHAPLVERAFAWRGTVDAWINNAGVDVLTGEAAGWSFEKKLHALWQVDVQATMRLSRLVGARMRTRSAGARSGAASHPPGDDFRPSLVNIGWDQAAHGMAGDSGELFAAVKGAVMAFSLSLAASLAPDVRVNCLAPGWIKTAWGEGASEAWQERARRESLLDRWGSPEDVARAAGFLVSPQAAFITGQVIPVNGGLRRQS